MSLFPPSPELARTLCLNRVFGIWMVSKLLKREWCKRAGKARAANAKLFRVRHGIKTKQERRDYFLAMGLTTEGNKPQRHRHPELASLPCKEQRAARGKKYRSQNILKGLTHNGKRRKHLIHPELIGLRGAERAKKYRELWREMRAYWGTKRSML